MIAWVFDKKLDKDSNPGKYDTSATGHVFAGEGPIKAAIRELLEKLGICVAPEQLQFVRKFRYHYEDCCEKERGLKLCFDIIDIPYLINIACRFQCSEFEI